MDFHNFRTSGELPKYASPFERNYISYYDAVRAFNGLLHLRISSLLTGILGQTPGIAFATTGSDGRYEKGPGSKVELLVIKRKNGIDVVEKAQKLVTSPPFSQLFDPTEVKELETDTFSYYRNDPTRVYPTRIFDMKFLHGDTKCLAEAYEKVIEEIKAPIGRRIKEHMSAHKRRAKVLMETGEQSIHAQTVQHYNLEEGAAFYGGLNGAVAESFKLGPLRYVQYSFAQSLLRNIGLERIYEWMNLPTNTVDRLLCLEGEKLTSLSEQEISEVADSYKFFIWLFHRSQHAFIQEHQTVTYFGANEVKERIRNLEAILGTGKL